MASLTLKRPSLSSAAMIGMKIKPLVNDVGKIAAKSKMVVPVTVRRVGAAPAAARRSDGKGPSSNALTIPDWIPCYVSGGIEYEYICGIIPVPKSAPIAFSRVDGQCDGNSKNDPAGNGKDNGNEPGGGPGDGPGNGPGAWGPGYSPTNPVVAAIEFAAPRYCDGCKWKAEGGVDVAFQMDQLSAALRDKVTALFPRPWEVEDVQVAIQTGGNLAACCVDKVVQGVEGKGYVKASATIEVFYGAEFELINEPVTIPGWAKAELEGEIEAGARLILTGDLAVELSYNCNGEWGYCISGKLQADVGVGPRIEVELELENSETDKVKTEVIGDVSLVGHAEVWAKSACGSDSWNIGGCANISAKAILQGSYVKDGTTITVGPSWTTELVAVGRCQGDPPPTPSVASFSTPRYVRSSAVDLTETRPMTDLASPPEEVLANLGLPPADSGVCAKVKLRLTQDLVLTRQGFAATLELNNQQTDSALSGVGFDLDIRDALDRPANDRFNIRVSKLERFGSIDGTGNLAPSSSGLAEWTLIPLDDAAPTSEQTYYVGGQIRYTEKGRAITIPVSNVPIRVRPNAALSVKYFHQRDVLSDDPHTDAIEPITPFYLGVMIEKQRERGGQKHEPHKRPANHCRERKRPAH